MFRGLSIFTGGWMLEAAEAVIVEKAVLETLSLLVDKGLVRRTEQPNQSTRFGMLEPVRQFARECLADRGDEE